MSEFRIAVVYVTDANYHELTLYSLASVARSHRAPLDLHLMQVGYDAAVDPAFARQINWYGHRLFVRRVSFEMPDKGSRGHAFWHAHVTDTTFLKAAAIESLAERYDYILYMDGDTLAFGDLCLDELVGFEEPVAACIDMSFVADDLRYRTTISPYTFFNAGLLLVNMQEWRRCNIYGHFLGASSQHQNRCPYFATCEPNDQCALNMALDGCWRPLALTFNTQRATMHTRSWSHATVRHYIGRNKFLPMRLHRCDPREHDLLCSISQETGLPHPGAFYDGGLSYWLNGIRRLRTVRKVERTLASMAHSETFLLRAV